MSDTVTITPEMVEAAAKFAWERGRESTEATATRRSHRNLARWDEAWFGEQEECRDEARDLLRAALDTPAPEQSQAEHGGTRRSIDGDRGYPSAKAEILALIDAANPGQSITVERHHVDRDGRWFTITTRPYETQVQAAIPSWRDQTPFEDKTGGVAGDSLLTKEQVREKLLSAKKISGDLSFVEMVFGAEWGHEDLTALEEALAAAFGDTQSEHPSETGGAA